MARRLQDILQEAKENSITEQEAIAKGVEKMMYLNMADIIRDSGEDYYAMLNFILEENQINEKENDKVCYLDFVGLFLNTLNKTKPNGQYLTKDEEYYMILDMVCKMLQKASKRNSVIQDFMDMNIHCLCEYMNKRKDNEVIRWKKRSFLQDDEDITVGQLLEKFKKETNTKWLPWRASDDYCKTIVKMYDGMGFVLLEIFANAYPERIHIEDLQEKLRGY